MELECHTGNIRVPCTVNQALAFLLQSGLPKIDNRETRTCRLVFVTHVPLSFHGFAHCLRCLRDEITELRKNHPLNGAVVTKWMDLMQVPVSCMDDCQKLKSHDLDAIWELALKQQVPISTIIRMFSS